MQAELYSRYIRQNLWKLRNRTETVNYDATDMQTWSLRQLMEKSQELYLASVADERLRKVQIEDFSAITGERANVNNLRPTLFDLLAHRAIDHFKNDRNTVIEPAYKFYIDKEAAFASTKDFIKTTFETKDSTSAKYQTLLLLQEVIEAHAKDKEPNSLIDADLKRLKFVYDNAVLSNKTELYIAALKQLSEKHKDRPVYSEIIFQLATAYQQKGQNYQPSPEEKGRWDLKTAADLCQEAIAKYPTAYGSIQCKNLLAQIFHKNVEIKTEQVNLPEQPILAAIAYRNIEKAYVKVVKLGYEEQSDFQRKSAKDIVEALNRKSAVLEQALDLPKEGDYHQHLAEFDLGTLPIGNYAVLVANNSSFSGEGQAVGYLFMHVSNIAFLSRTDGDGQVQLAVMDRKSGEPLKNVIAEIYSRDYDSKSRKNVYNKIASVRSDAKGFIRPDVNAKNYFKVKLIHGEDVLYLEDAFSSYRYSRQNNPATTHTHFFLDRAIYRPGQTVYFKGIVIQKQREGLPTVQANQKVVVQFRDANRQEVEKLELTSNEYGSITGSFTVPKAGLLGQMSIQASVGGDHYFRVEEYKRPKFEVDFDPIVGAYKLGEEVTIKGNAIAFAGNSIGDSEVKYRVVRQVRFPYRPYWFYRYNPYQQPEMEIVNGTTVTKADGTFEIRFEALPDLAVPAEQKPEFTYKVYADVVDITGETQSAETRISVGYIALSMDVKIAEKLDRDKPAPYQIISQNLAGQFEAAKGTIKVEALETPNQVYKNRLWEQPDTYLLTESAFKQKFIDYPYKDEQEIQNWTVKREVFKEDFNTLNKKALALPIKKWDAGKYRLTLNTEDKYGEKIEVVKYIEVFDLDKKSVAVNSPDWLYQSKETYEPGEKATVYVGSALAPIHALIEVEKQGKIMESYWQKIKGIDKIEFPVKETDRGNFHYHISFTKDNRSYRHTKTVNVPWSNKELTIEYATFRDKLLPGQDEEWQVKISGPKKEKVAAEMVAGMYDASLDQFAANNWLLNIYPVNGYPQIQWQPRGFNISNTRLYAHSWQPAYENQDARVYPSLNWFGFSGYGGRVAYTSRRSRSMAKPRSAGAVEYELDEMAMAAPAPMATMAMEGAAMDADGIADKAGNAGKPKGERVEEQSLQEAEKEQGPKVPVRTNLKETVFFLPDLKTDAAGNIIIKFKMNEALTRWKFLGLAHTKDLKFATTQKEIVTQKDLMVSPNPPRFFREGDEMEFTAKVSNLSDSPMQGEAEIELLDAVTMQPVSALLGITKQQLSFTVAPGQSAPLSWKIKVPIGKVNAITHRVTCKAGNYSDGEESMLPVLSNRMLVTESKPLAVRGKQKKTFNLESLEAMKGSSTMTPHLYTLEFTSNPAWYAVQALPYLMEYPYDCTEQIFSRFYANTLASSVANAHPRINKVFESWKGTKSDALKSNLSKNQELKSALLEETPWVINAQSEEEQKRNIGLLFDMNRMADEQAIALAKIKERQLSNGGFSWFPGGRDSWYITQHLVEGMGHLKKLNAYGNGEEREADELLTNAIRYIDARAVEAYENLKKQKEIDLKEDHLSNIMIHYLYARSFFLDTEIQASTKEAFDYYVDQSEKYWLNKGIYQNGMIGLALDRIKPSGVTTSIIKSLKERAIKNEELGMYWKQSSGYFWYQLPMETHSIMIELFEEVAKDKEAVNELKVWLLKNKQTNHWKTTKATSSVVYALLMSGNNWLVENEQVAVKLGNSKSYQTQIAEAQATPEAGTGYFKTSWNGDAIKEDMGTITVDNPNEQPAWGAVYWQYFEDLDKIKTFEETPLTINKKLFKEVSSDTGPKLTPITEKETLSPGDKIKVRVEIRVDRPMEYVHLKDTRAAGFEPINVLSGYKYQGGLGYYESTKDASTNFFIDYLPRGTFVFEYPLRVVHKGDFSNGITSMQCMYAPEFSSHSEGIRVKVQ